MKEKNKIKSRDINYGKRGSILTSLFDLTLNLSIFLLFTSSLHLPSPLLSFFLKPNMLERLKQKMRRE